MPDANTHLRAFLLDSNGSPEMAVDGSTTTQAFRWGCKQGKWTVHSLSFIFHMHSGRVYAERFGDRVALNTGLLIGFYDLSGARIFAGTVAFKSNLQFLQTGAALVTPTVRKRCAIFTYYEPLGVTLTDGDYVEVLVRDDLRQLLSLRAYLVAFHGTP